jgi:PAS domain S-box-containing protein
MTHSVLIVDDNAENLYFLEALLKGNGFAVRSARNGAQALESALKEPPDLVVSDILMPVMDGYALCREWRANDRLKELPFIFYTATYTEKQDEELALSLGADRFVVKPQEPAALMGIIRETLAAPRSGTAGAASGATRSEGELLKDYSEVLFRKLEKKMAELERTNRELRESEQQFRQFVMECPVPIAVSAQDGTVELLNERFLKTFGYTLEDIPGLDAWWPLAYPDPVYRNEVMRSWQAAIEKALRDGGVVRDVADYRVTCKDGTVRIVEISGAAIANRFLVLFNDITERARTDEEIRCLAAELEQRVRERTGQLETTNKELEAFAYSVSHDLRAPLRAIEGFSGIVIEDYGQRLDDEGRRLLGVIRTNARRMSRLIDDLLVFSRTGRREMACSRLDMREMAQSVFEEIVGDPGARARIDFRLGALPGAEGDAALVRQVWVNLIANAVKFSSLKEPCVIEVAGEPEGNQSVYHVRDNGVGFDMQYAHKLFGVFQRLHAPGDFEGTGIGLALVQRIVARHGGRVWAQGAVGEGATFSFSLPAGEAQER